MSSDHPSPPRSRRRRVVLWALMVTTALSTMSAGVWWWRSTQAMDAGDLPVTISQQLGIDALHETLGDAAMPTGRGIVIGHVESRQKGSYLPAIHASRFAGVNFHIRSGESGASGHASATATILYGPKGLAPGVTQVECFASDHWMGPGLLHLGGDRPALGAFPVRLFTHSWISYDFPHEGELLQRVDELVDQQGVMVVAGVNNGRGSPVPPILAGAYNVIAVGDWEGNSSAGYTTIDAIGRCKPDLVAPGGLTSFATPAVAALAARLMEVADGQEIDRTIQPLVIKAVLMAGADKPGDWRAEPGKPLDDRYGAGRPRLDHSYDMLTHPLQGRPPALAGWDHRHIQPQSAMTYRLLAHQPLKELTVALVWHRRVDSAMQADAFGRRLRRVFTARLARLHLRLMTVGEAAPESPEPPSPMAQSTSDIDNVQYLHLRDLPAGRYDILINRMDDLDESWNYALAWRAVEAGSQDEKPSSDH